MSGIDFVLERPVERSELRAAIVAALGPCDLEVVGDVEELTGKPVQAVASDTGGEFRTHVSLDGGSVGVDTVRTIVRALDTPALVPDETSTNPYAFVLIRPDGSAERVALQAEPLDERDEYRLLPR